MLKSRYKLLWTVSSVPLAAHPRYIQIKVGISRVGCFRLFVNFWEISKTRTTPYRPNSNGQCEVFISRGLKDWDGCLPLITMALHSMKNHTTGFSANMMMLGRETIQPLDFMLGQVDFSQVDADDWVRSLISRMSEIHVSARDEIGQIQLRQKRDYDLRLKERTFSPGDPVYLRDSSTKVGVSTKLRPPWKGPFVVRYQNHPLYKLESNKKSLMVHHDRLKLCRDSDLPLWLKRKRHEILNLDHVSQDELSELDQTPDERQTNTEPEMDIDMDETLPYMLPDDPEVQIQSELDQDSVSESNVEGELTAPSPKSKDPTFASPAPEHPLPTSRVGRKIRLPARLRDAQLHF